MMRKAILGTCLVALPMAAALGQAPPPHPAEPRPSAAPPPVLGPDKLQGLGRGLATAVDPLYTRCMQELADVIAGQNAQRAIMTDAQRRERAEVAQSKCLHPSAPSGRAELAGELNFDLANLGKAYLSGTISSAQYYWWMHLATEQYGRLARQASGEAYKPISTDPNPPPVPDPVSRVMADERYDNIRDQLLARLKIPLQFSCTDGRGPSMSRPIATRVYHDVDIPAGVFPVEVLVKKIGGTGSQCPIYYVLDFSWPRTDSRFFFGPSDDVSDPGASVAVFRLKPENSADPNRYAIARLIFDRYPVKVAVETMDAVGRRSERSLATPLPRLPDGPP